QARGTSVTTIEGLAKADGTLHPMQEAFREHHGLQCGFCTPGMVMMGIDIARRHPHADEQTVRHELEGNICRCTGYQGIVEAIVDASAKMADAGEKV
ncbi:MAG: coxS, partial [Hyphomicrobiales bacterium]|nr:coxS [Hyphomicrobiales bacterium]